MVKEILGPTSSLKVLSAACSARKLSRISLPLMAFCHPDWLLLPLQEGARLLLL